MLAEIWAGVVLALVLIYWTFWQPLTSLADNFSPEKCNAIQRGMNLQQVMKFVDSEASPYFETFHEHRLRISMVTSDTCQVDFDSTNKVISSNVVIRAD